MPIDKQKGPGGVSASYGTRASKKLSDRQSSGEVEKVVPSELWSAGQVVYASDIRRLPTGENIVCVVGGTTGTTAPVIPHGAAPAAIVDNTATWWALDIYDNTFVENSGTSALPLTTSSTPHRTSSTGAHLTSILLEDQGQLHRAVSGHC